MKYLRRSLFTTHGNSTGHHRIEEPCSTIPWRAIAIRFTLACIGLLFAALSGISQTQNSYSFPFKEGNFLRYRIAYSQAPADSSFMLSFKPPNMTEHHEPDMLLDTVVVMRSGPRILDMLDFALVRITSEGVFTVSDSLFSNPRSNREYQYFPAVPPRADTMTLYNTRRYESGTEIISEHHVSLLRQFDTTVFDTPARAFSIEIEKGDKREILTIADGYGIVGIELWSVVGGLTNAAHLSGAVIDGRRYNWDPVPRNFLPLCEGDVYQFRTQVHRFWPPPQGDTTLIETDTVRSAGMIQGTEYMNFKNKYLSSESGGIYYYEYGNDAPRKRLRLPSHAEPGCIVGTWEIKDTSTVTLFGERRMVMTLTPFYGEQSIADGPDMSESWTDGIGLTESFTGCNGCMFYSTNDYGTLLFASICGTEYGIKTGIRLDNSHQPEGILMHQNYPNPVSLANGYSTTIVYEIDQAADVHLQVYNSLGQKVAMLVHERQSVGVYSTLFNVASLPAGVYFAVLRVSTSASVSMRRISMMAVR